MNDSNFQKRASNGNGLLTPRDTKQSGVKAKYTFQALQNLANIG